MPHDIAAASAFLPPEAAQALLDRWAAVRARVDGAARAAGRDPAGVTLVAVSKFHPAASVAALAAAGQRDFGENYVQEALRKQAEVADMTGMGPDAASGTTAAGGAAPRWHFIGHLQSNKAKDVVGRFALLHTVDSETLARKLDSGFPACPRRGPGALRPVRTSCCR